MNQPQPNGASPEGMKKHVILIAGDDEDVAISFAEMVGHMEHMQTEVVEMPPDILDQIASGQIDTIIFCPKPELTKKGKVKNVGAPKVFVPEKPQPQ